MNTSWPVFFVFFGLYAIYLLYEHYRPKTYADVVISPPAVLRTDLKFCYFGVYDDQVAQTKAHTNWLWECHFQGNNKALANILEAAMDTVLSCGDQLYEKFQDSGRNWRLRADAEAQLRAYFQFLRDGGALQYVKVVVPFDEPNISVATAELVKGIAVIKKVAAEFAELTGLKLATIYASQPETYDCIELFDYVGVDDYSMVSAILTNGTYAKLKARLAPHQQTLLIPGGSFGQDITPFVNFAQANAEVAAIVAFTWFGAPTPADVNAIAGHPWVGIGASPLRTAYVKAGATITGK